MNREETLTLFAQGGEVWNAWAEGMRAERERLKEAGDCVDDSNKDVWNDATRNWHAHATADFSGHEFKGDASFAEFIFPDYVDLLSATFSEYTSFWRATLYGFAAFGGATFSGNADFRGATFYATADFVGTTFSRNTSFEGTTFSGDADFVGAAFARYVDFGGATFVGDGWFDQAKFETVSSFAGAQFEGYAIFHAMRGGLSFSLADVLFLVVPDFTEANFNEAPRLDNLHIETGRFAPFYVLRIRKYFKANPGAELRWRERRFRNWRLFKGDPDLSAKWRALKGLAVKGHDHEQELKFFRGELLAQRWLPGKRLRLLFWAGWAYQVFSDFGRSILRPFLWWLAGIAGFGCFYLGQTPLLASTPGAGFLWGWEWAKSRSFGGISGLPCVAGDGDPVTAALQLSLHKALPFLGLGSSGHIDRFYACLYGVKPSPLSSRFIPVIPDFVAGIAVVQILFSTAMIFLFLLALRNHFRIK